MFSSRIRLKSLALTCRSLSTLLGSGVAIQKAFDVASGKAGDPRCRTALIEVADEIRKGSDVTDAMKSQGDRFPRLMIDMIDVGEQTGAFPEVLRGLADHYDNNLRLRRSFLAAIAWPVFQFIAAVLVIALLILVLGWIAETRGGEPADILGLNLTGASGATLWLTCTFGSVSVLFLVYQILVKSFQGKRILDPLFMKIPVLGNCMRSFAIARFSWAFALTQQSGMSIKPSIRASFRATTNGAFTSAARSVWDRISSGEKFTDALAATELFPADYLHMIEVAEESGTVPEMLDRLSPEFEEQARRSLNMLAATLGWIVWGLVAMFIIFLIFSIMLWYTGMISDLANEI